MTEQKLLLKRPRSMYVKGRRELFLPPLSLPHPVMLLVGPSQRTGLKVMTIKYLEETDSVLFA